MDSAHKNAKACRRHYVPLPHRVFHMYPERKKKNEDDYCNLPTIIFCADAFPAHRCPFIEFFVN